MANDTTVADQDTVNGEQSDDTNSDASDQSETQSQKLYDFNGQQFTADQLAESYGNLQKDYTKKTQELTQLKKSDVESKDGSEDETVRAKEALKKLGVITDDYLEEKLEEKLKQRDEVVNQQRELDSLIADNPSLSSYKDAIVAIGKTDKRSYYDIAVSYNFAAKDKLQRAKRSEPTGAMPNKVRKESKTIKDMTPAEYDVWRKENLKGSRI